MMIFKVFCPPKFEFLMASFFEKISSFWSKIAPNIHQNMGLSILGANTLSILWPPKATINARFNAVKTFEISFWWNSPKKSPFYVRINACEILRMTLPQKLPIFVCVCVCVARKISPLKCHTHMADTHRDLVGLNYFP